MPATFSWEREWLREASLHELSARALCDVALPGVAAAKQHFVTTTKSPTSPRSPPVVVKPLTLQFSTRRPLDFGAAARAGRSPANDAQALQRQLAAAGLSPGRLHMLRGDLLKPPDLRRKQQQPPFRLKQPTSKALLPLYLPPASLLERDGGDGAASGGGGGGDYATASATTASSCARSRTNANDIDHS